MSIQELSNDQRDDRLARLVSVGAGLITILEKGVEYLPSLMEYFCCEAPSTYGPDKDPIKTQLTPEEFQEIFGLPNDSHEQLEAATYTRLLIRAIRSTDFEKVNKMLRQSAFSFENNRSVKLLTLLNELEGLTRDFVVFSDEQELDKPIHENHPDFHIFLESIK